MREGDTFFRGVDCRRDPELLEPGLCAWAENVDFCQGAAETRRGMRAVWWARRLGVNLPVSFPFSFTIASGVGSVLGAGIFADPYGLEYVLVATPAGVWRVREGCEPEVIPYANEVDVNAVAGAVEEPPPAPADDWEEFYDLWKLKEAERILVTSESPSPPEGTAKRGCVRFVRVKVDGGDVTDWATVGGEQTDQHLALVAGNAMAQGDGVHRYAIEYYGYRVDVYDDDLPGWRRTFHARTDAFNVFRLEVASS